MVTDSPHSACTLRGELVPGHYGALVTYKPMIPPFFLVITIVADRGRLAAEGVVPPPGLPNWLLPSG